MNDRHVVFRADSSIDIGTGHVMRCLTLAEQLRQQGARCLFVSREHAGNLLSLVHERGFEAARLPVQDVAEIEVRSDEGQPEHARWLGASWQIDARETLAAIAGLTVDWLVVDHYALDHRWESELKTACHKLMVIDDLVDRRHDCDFFLNQNLGRRDADHSALVPKGTKVLLGPDYALLRPEFSELRESAVRRRDTAPMRRILVSMGGIDKGNATAQVLATLRSAEMPADCQVTIVMGKDAPWLEEIHGMATSMPFPTVVISGVANMARLMAESDLAIGAAGGTALERCCMGLPSIIIVMAENQRHGAREMARTDSALVIESAGDISEELPHAIATMVDDAYRMQMSLRCRRVTDGNGCERVVAAMSRFNGSY